MQFYTVQKFIHDFIEKEGFSMRCKAENYNDFVEWRAKAKEQFKEKLGINLLNRYLSDIGYKKEIINARKGETTEFDDHTRVKIYLETMPSVTMPLYILIPKNDIKNEAVITPHGHGGGGKEAIVGNTENPLIEEQIKPHMYDYGLEFVRKGYTVFAPDSMGFGERREEPHQGAAKSLNSSCGMLSHIFNPLGLSVSGMWVYELMRLADYVQTFDNITKIHCAGLSGGGLQTLYFTALDDRIESAVVSGYFYGVVEALIDLPFNCECNFAREYMLDFDMGDIAAMAAPRKITIQTGDNDGLNGRNGTSNAVSQTEIAKKAYKLCGCEENFVHKIYKGGHRWYGFEEL